MNCWTTARIFIMSALICSTTADTKGEDDVCKTADCMRLGLELSDAINASADPCDDFYDYVCKKWKNKTEIPPYLPSYGHLWLIRDEVAKKINDTLGNMNQTKLQAESLNETIAIAYQSCMKEDSSEPNEEISRLRNTLEKFGIPKWPMTPGSNETINWTEIYRKMRIGADLSVIFSVNVNPNLTNTSLLAIHIDVSEFLHTLDRIYKVRQQNDIAVEAYKDFIKQTVILFSGEEDINVTTKIAQDIFDFEVNLTKKINEIDFDVPDLPDYNFTGDYRYDYEEESSSPTDNELLQARSDKSTSQPEKDPEPTTKLKDIDRKLKSGWLQLLTDIFQDASVNLTGEEEVNALDEGFIKGAMKLLNKTSGVVVNNYFGWKLLY
uniref:Putative peptidase family m13 includes neprilysin n=1 Tax=Ixodes ricinus TaxID=34613 RepID=A0A0K8RJI9_IXORI